MVIPLSESEIYLGLTDQGLYIQRNPYLAILRALQERPSRKELIHMSEENEDVIDTFLRELSAHGYLQIIKAGKGVTPSSSLDDQLRFDRSVVEKSALEWRPGVTDGGWAEFDARQGYSILIFGRTRIARSLLALLQASGFSRTRIVLPSNFYDSEVGTKDICGVVTRKSDLGSSLREHHKIITRGAQIAPEQEKPREDINLIVSTTNADLGHHAYIQRWMSEDLPDILISQPNLFTVEIGPLVIPGKSACARCISLHKSDSLPPFISIFDKPDNREVASATSTLVAAVITSYIAEYAATGTSSLFSTSIVINVLNPLADRIERLWDLHPACGCSAS